MASDPSQSLKSRPQFLSQTLATYQSSNNDDDDDFQNPNEALSFAHRRILCSLQNPSSQSHRTKPSKTSKTSIGNRPTKKPRKPPTASGKGNQASVRTVPIDFTVSCSVENEVRVSGFERVPCSLSEVGFGVAEEESGVFCSDKVKCKEEDGLKNSKGGNYSKSIESRLLGSRIRMDSVDNGAGEEVLDFEAGTQLNELMDLCSEIGRSDEVAGMGDGMSNEGNAVGVCVSEVELGGVVECPLCGADITELSDELRILHTNDCLDKNELSEATVANSEMEPHVPTSADVNRVLEWLQSLGLSKYEEIFVKEEIDWATLQWLTEEDLLNIGIDVLGPRKKIVHAISELRCKNNEVQEINRAANLGSSNSCKTKSSIPGNKLITEFFQGSSVDRHGIPGHKKSLSGKSAGNSSHKRTSGRNLTSKRKVKDIPQWCSIPGTPFRVDAFRYLRGDCSHWFLTHFHLDHYQGLTRNFCHGNIYCSSITAHLVNTKIGVPWERLQILPINQKVTIAGVSLTCLDANHCPGSIMILFEPPNGKAVLHTGDFRFSAEMAGNVLLQSSHVHTLILDTTYCSPQYDFPKQEAVIQFVLEAIQAEAFNPKTLFLIGSYTIGKERLYLEIARILKKKVYVGLAKLQILRCLGLSDEDMQWFTTNDMESHIHVVPMWTIASFKRMKYISNQYSTRFDLIVAFSPTGWAFGKGKKKTTGRRWQQGTIIRYEVPYSEHCSFTELQEFVKFVSPEQLIPSVNNDSPESTNAMIAQLLNED